MSVRVICAVQARLGSTRFPEKILKPILGKPMIWHQWERMAQHQLSGYVPYIVCPKSDAYRIETADRELEDRVVGFSGDQNDLIMRHLSLAVGYGADLVVRIPGDNPLAWAPDIDKMISKAIYSDLHLRHDGIFSNINERDTGCEVWPVKALHYLNANVTDPEIREHPHRFFKAQEEWDAERTIPYHFDVNTEEDYLFVSDIFNHFGHNRFSPEEAIEYVESK